jgi:hypothetical protein
MYNCVRFALRATAIWIPQNNGKYQNMSTMTFESTRTFLQ